MDDKSDQAARLLRDKRGGHWYDNGVRFRCIHPLCSDCCSGRRGPGYVWLGEGEMRAIADHLGIKLDAFTRRFVRTVDGNYSLVEKHNNDCVFLEEGKCTIYPVRPVQCRTYPFWPEVMTSRQRWQRESRACPGVEVDETMVSGAQVEAQLSAEELSRASEGRV
ncbi:MAG: YkgJ family cysteine cluster protein [Planctomycetes bacterium]|nr:YkgJ family cysteine cluster protein [Planctomycetota bacterium]MCW8135254.1 YkgJ family cysteine cluster protein [Planctomycetota bacterium]